MLYTPKTQVQLYDKQGKRHLEFIRHHGTFDDFPYEQCLATLKQYHPRLFMGSGQTIGGNLSQERYNEALALRWPLLCIPFADYLSEKN